ncbi:MAG: glycerol kinase [Chloroflexi bacterium RBG_16_57_11]|nr:MAG: glycerol kinase [Chloroflexi bacterium RBG_16_57_11]
MAMKKFINKAENLVPELIDGFVKANPEIVKQSGERIVSRVIPKEAGKVGVVTMGGAGHEPALIGWVGKGLMDVVALGDIFAAPGAPRVIEALKQADFGAGVVLVVFNHEGDVLSSNMVIQMAGRQGLKMKRILSSDDISNAPRDDQENRRGLIGTLMVLKVVGAAAEAGYSFEEVLRVGEKMSLSTATIAVAATPATHPATGHPFFSLPDDEMEIGMGQHGEAGVGRMKLKSADETADIMLTQLLKDLDVKPGDKLVATINGTGATTLMEMFIVFRHLTQILEEKGIQLVGSQIGELLTVQEQGGFQMSIGRVDDELERLFKAPCNAPYYKVC